MTTTVQTPAGNPGNALFFNTLPFHYPVETLPVAFYTEPSQGLHRFLSSQVPAVLTRELNPARVPNCFYARFQPGETDRTVLVDLAAHPEIARAWCMSRIVKVLAPQADYFYCANPEKPEFWFTTAADASALPVLPEWAGENIQWHTAHRFSLQVLHQADTGEPELLVGYNGAAHILQYSLDALTAAGTDSRLFGLVAFRRRICHWNKLPVKAHHHSGEVFPVLNSDLAGSLPIERPPRHFPDRYNAAYSLIGEFVQKYCMTEKFRDAIPHSGKFRAVAPGQSGLLTGSRRRLLFGQGRTHTDPLEGMKQYGPARRPAGTHFRCFFIHFEQNRGEAERLHRYLTGREGPLKLNLFTCLPMSYAPEHTIVIGPGEDPKAQVTQCLQRTTFDPTVIYYAFYISPWPKSEQDTGRQELYYHIKELLVHRRVSMQALEAKKLNGDFSMAVGTIGCALVAKLGGLPWRPEGNWQKDLVVGFATLHRKGKAAPQQSAAVHFNPGGRFGGATLYPAGDSRSVAGLALVAFRECQMNYRKVQRLVIHFYREFTDGEMELLKKMLHETGLDIPVVVAAIRTCRSSGLLVLGNPNNSPMPPDGTWTRCGTDSYLLNINGAGQQGQSCGKQVLPLRIDFRCTCPGHLGEDGVAEELLDQVYGFTRMHWHSAQQLPLPVTLTYPARLATFVPWFRKKLLPVHGRRVPWFL